MYYIIECAKCPAVHRIPYGGEIQFRKVFDCHCGQKIILSRYAGEKALVSGGSKRNGRI